jgi:hypothetical protein
MAAESRLIKRPSGTPKASSQSPVPFKTLWRMDSKTLFQLWIGEHLKPEDLWRIIKRITERMQVSRYLSGLATLSHSGAAERELSSVPGTGWAETAEAPPWLAQSL